RPALAVSAVDGPYVHLLVLGVSHHLQPTVAVEVGRRGHGVDVHRFRPAGLDGAGLLQDHHAVSDADGDLVEAVPVEVGQHGGVPAYKVRTQRNREARERAPIAGPGPDAAVVAGRYDVGEAVVVQVP